MYHKSCLEDMRQVLIGHILGTADPNWGYHLLLSNHATLVACLDSFSGGLVSEKCLEEFHGKKWSYMDLVKL